jgi:hypothetical protein
LRGVCTGGASAQSEARGLDAPGLCRLFRGLVRLGRVGPPAPARQHRGFGGGPHMPHGVPAAFPHGGVAAVRSVAHPPRRVQPRAGMKKEAHRREGDRRRARDGKGGRSVQSWGAGGTLPPARVTCRGRTQGSARGITSKRDSGLASPHSPHCGTRGTVSRACRGGYTHCRRIGDGRACSVSVGPGEPRGCCCVGCSRAELLRQGDRGGHTGCCCTGDRSGVQARVRDVPREILIRGGGRTAAYR